MSEEKKEKSAIDHIYEFLHSVKLSIFVLIGLAATSIIGTVLQQGKEPDFYLHQYPSLGKVINLLNLGDMYHSWWFLVLLALLMINITFCSLKRIPHAIKQMKDKDPFFDKRTVAIHQKATFVSGFSADETAEKVSKVLASKMGNAEKSESDGAVYFMSSKGSFSRMGVYITHLSLFLFALGAIVGTLWGFKGMVNIIEGRTAKEVYDRSKDGMTPIDFELRLDKFELSHYPNSMRPKDYKSSLVVIENGREIESKTIEVNDPLIYKGIYFYQSSYGKVGIQSVKLSIAGPDRNIIHTNVPLMGDQTLRLPDGYGIAIRDMWKDESGESPDGVVFALVKDGAIVTTGRAYEQQYGRPWWPLGNYQVRIDAVDWLEYTGLQVAKDPGVPIVWAGCIIITIGLLISFFMSHRRVWAKVQNNKGSVEVVLAGNASRNRLAFEKWFEDFKDEVSDSIKK